MYSFIGKTHQKQKQLTGLNKGTSSNENKTICGGQTIRSSNHAKDGTGK